MSGRPALLKPGRKFEFLAWLQNNQKVRYSDIRNRAAPDCRHCSTVNIGLIYIQWQGQIGIFMICPVCWALKSLFSNEYFGKGKSGSTHHKHFQVSFSSLLLNYLLQWSHSLRSLLGKGLFLPQPMFYSTWTPTNLFLIPAGGWYTVEYCNIKKDWGSQILLSLVCKYNVIPHIYQLVAKRKQIAKRFHIQFYSLP